MFDSFFLICLSPCFSWKNEGKVLQFSFFSMSSLKKWLPLFSLIILLLSLLSLAQVSTIGMASGNDWVEMESDHTGSRIGNDPELQLQQERASPEIEQECVWYLHELGKEQLEKTLLDVSNPKSANYGKYLTKEEIDAMTVNPVAIQAVTDYLHQVGATITKQNGNVITATAPLSVWETTFNTQFFAVHSEALNNQIVYRARDYFLPKNIAPLVNMVTNTVQMPVKVHHGPIISRRSHPRPIQS
jgi:hypothetical protein